MFSGYDLIFVSSHEKGQSFRGMGNVFCLNPLAVGGAAGVSGEKGANIRQPTPPTHTDLFSCSISQMWPTVFVQMSRMYFLAEKGANIYRPFSANTHQPYLVQYFTNFVNCICPTAESLLAEKLLNQS